MRVRQNACQQAWIRQLARRFWTFIIIPAMAAAGSRHWQAFYCPERQPAHPEPVEGNEREQSVRGFPAQMVRRAHHELEARCWLAPDSSTGQALSVSKEMGGSKAYVVSPLIWFDGLTMSGRRGVGSPQIQIRGRQLARAGTPFSLRLSALV